MITQAVLSADTAIGSIIGAANMPNAATTGPFAAMMDSVTAAQVQPPPPPVATEAVGAELALSSLAAPAAPATYAASAASPLTLEARTSRLLDEGTEIDARVDVRNPIQAAEKSALPSVASVKEATLSPVSRPEEEPLPVAASRSETAPNAPLPVAAVQSETAPSAPLADAGRQEMVQQPAAAVPQRLSGEAREVAARRVAVDTVFADIAEPSVLSSRGGTSSPVAPTKSPAIAAEKREPNGALPIQFETIAASVATSEMRVGSEGTMTFAITSPQLTVPNASVAAPLPALPLPDLDTSNGDAWLDQLARDISAAQSADGNLSFRLLPRNLGQIDVAMQRSDAGLAIQIATDNDAARSMMAAAQPRLIEEMRDHGVRIVSADVARVPGDTDRGHADGGNWGGSNTGGSANDRPRHMRDALAAFIETADRRAANPHSQPPGRRGRFA